MSYYGISKLKPTKDSKTLAEEELKEFDKKLEALDKKRVNHEQDLHQN